MTGTSDLEERVARAIQTTLGVSPLMAHTAARAAIEACGVENLTAALAKEKEATAELTVENELLGKQMDRIASENDGLTAALAKKQAEYLKVCNYVVVLHARVAALEAVLTESRTWLNASLGLVNGDGPPNWDGIREHIEEIDAVLAPAQPDNGVKATLL